jgi:hypothetical protein
LILDKSKLFKLKATAWRLSFLKNNTLSSAKVAMFGGKIKLSLCLIKHHTMKKYGGMEV